MSKTKPETKPETAATAPALPNGVISLLAGIDTTSDPKQTYASIAVLKALLAAAEGQAVDTVGVYADALANVANVGAFDMRQIIEREHAGLLTATPASTTKAKLNSLLQIVADTAKTYAEKETQTAYARTLDDWSEKLATTAMQGAASVPKALLACTTLPDALNMLNGALDRIIAHAKASAIDKAKVDGGLVPAFTMESWEYKQSLKLLYDAVKKALANYSFAYIPENRTIGQKNGRFEIKPVQAKKPDNTDTAEKLAELEKTEALERANKLAEMVANSGEQDARDKRITELEGLLKEKEDLSVRLGTARDNAITRANKAETELKTARVQMAEMARQLALFENIAKNGGDLTRELILPIAK